MTWEILRLFIPHTGSRIALNQDKYNDQSAHVVYNHPGIRLHFP